MSTAPLNPHPETDMTSEEWWQLFDELRLSQQADYAEYGGPVAFIRNERNADLA